MNPEQWLSLKWNGGSTMSDRWLNQSKIIHLRGFAKEKDLGMAAAFLCSDAARFISGIDLVVDGGISSSFLL